MCRKRWDETHGPQAFGSRRQNFKKKFRDYALTSKGRSVCSPRRTGEILRMASFMDKAGEAISTLSFALTYSVLLSTIFDGFPLSPEREICDILLLSFIQTKWNQLSTDRQQRPGCQYYRNQRLPKVMDLQPMTTSYCRHSPFLSRTGNVSHAFVNQFLHSCPLQE